MDNSLKKQQLDTKKGVQFWNSLFTYIFLPLRAGPQKPFRSFRPRDLQDSSECQLQEQRGFPGTPSDLYLLGLDVRR